MSDETILKSSFFGGYKKNDVMQYIDYILEENEKTVKKMEEQIAILVKENKKLKVRTKKENPILFPAQITNETANNEALSVKQQMNLPEGSYIISKEHKVITLPDPLPIYQTKTSNARNEAADEGETDIMARLVEENAAYVALTKESHTNRKQQSQIAEDALEEIKAVELRKDEREKTASIKNIPEMYQQDSIEELEQLKAELTSVKKMLEVQKKEKQILVAKLEYSNELLLQLYKNK